jgi:hypothetical protein
VVAPGPIAAYPPLIAQKTTRKSTSDSPDRFRSQILTRHQRKAAAATRRKSFWKKTNTPSASDSTGANEFFGMKRLVRDNSLETRDPMIKLRWKQAAMAPVV